jgi:hypothetical protein
LEQFGHLGHQVLRHGVPDALAGHQDDVSVIGLRRDLPPGRPKDPPGSVPLYRAADPACGHEGGPSRAGRDQQYHPSSVQGCASVEHGTHALRVHGQPDRRVRPLVRRRDRIVRPARVFMRCRKPWVFARRRVLGWNVRLDISGEPFDTDAGHPAGTRDSIRAAIDAGQRA